MKRMYQPLYDKLPVTPYTKSLRFFQVPLGNSRRECAEKCSPKVAKSVVSNEELSDCLLNQCDTNMDQGASLPYPKSFFITGLSLVSSPHADPCAVMAYLSNSWARLFIKTYDYLVLPAQFLHKFSNEFSWSKPGFSFAEPGQPIELRKDEIFRVEVNTPNAVAEGGFSLHCLLHGYFEEPPEVARDGSWRRSRWPVIIAP